MKPTPMTNKIMHLHKETIHKLATPANELALQSAVESLERDRAELIEALRLVLRIQDGEQSLAVVVNADSPEIGLGDHLKALLSRLGADK